MRTYRQELEIQVLEIFEEFYKEKIDKEQLNTFSLSNLELEDMLSDDYFNEETGYFYYDYYEVYWELQIANGKRTLKFIKGGW